MCSPSSYAEILMPNVMVLGDRVLKGEKAMRVETLVCEIHALIKEAPERSLAPSSHEEEDEKCATQHRALAQPFRRSDL